MQDNNDLNAGAATDASSDSIASGSQNVDTSVSSGTPDNQNGTQTNSGNEDTAKLREEIRRLNQAVVEAKRGNRNNNQQNNQNGANPFETPEGQYGIAIKLATGDLRNKTEDLFSLYPELPSEEIARIRKNPWAFASHEAFINADWETAALEIEQAMLERADAINAAKSNPVNNPNPANVNTNPVQDDASNASGDQGEDLWNMPLDELEGKAKQAVAKVSKSK